MRLVLTAVLGGWSWHSQYTDVHVAYRCLVVWGLWRQAEPCTLAMDEDCVPSVRASGLYSRKLHGLCGV